MKEPWGEDDIIADYFFIRLILIIFAVSSAYCCGILKYDIVNCNLIKLSMACMCVCAIAASCTTSKQILYFQDIDTAEIDRIVTNYEPVIKRDDILKIVVSGPDKLVVQPYNLTLGEVSTYSSTSPEDATLQYHVDKDGYIDFPVLGRIKVLGMTRQDLVKYLTTELRREVKDPVVYVSFANFKVTVLGEVKNPGTYNVTSERITILQALGMAGDLNLTARRDGIILIRDENGLNTHIKIDLKTSDILSSPYFYLQQNDVIYVPASPTRVATATTTPLWSTILSGVTTFMSVVSVILSVVTLAGR